MPSKKIISVFIVVAALVFAIIIAFGRDKSSVVINVASNLVTGDKISIPENPAWQEELLKANAKAEKVQIENSTSTEETVTDKASIGLISNYLALKQNNKLDSTSAQKLIDQTILYVGQASSPGTKIARSDLKIIPDNGSQSITSYGENLGNIARTKSPAEINKDVALIVALLKSDDQSKLKELDTVITGYKNIVNTLLKMPVPETFVKAHLDIINGTNDMTSALMTVKNVSTDPLKAITSLQLYQTGLTTLTQATSAVITFIKQNNIIYKQGSGGYYLLYEIK
ncbi:MAG: hypothetical protein AAB446_00455 [Patescibacteria group bacterium]